MRDYGALYRILSSYYHRRNFSSSLQKIWHKQTSELNWIKTQKFFLVLFVFHPFYSTLRESTFIMVINFCCDKLFGFRVSYLHYEAINIIRLMVWNFVYMYTTLRLREQNIYDFFRQNKNQTLTCNLSDLKKNLIKIQGQKHRNVLKFN